MKRYTKRSTSQWFFRFSTLGSLLKWCELKTDYWYYPLWKYSYNNRRKAMKRHSKGL